MTSSNFTNPAARLYTVLREAKKQPDNKSIKDVWNSVFIVETDGLIPLLRNLVILSNLVDEVEKEILQLEVNHDVYLKHFPTIREVLSPSNFHESWQVTKRRLAEEVLGSLEFCSERLNALRPEKNLSKEDLEKISKEVKDLFSLVDKAELPEELRCLLLDVVQMLQSALMQYRIRGVSGLRQELFIIMDRLQRHYDDLSVQENNPTVQAVFKTLGHWDVITSVAVNTSQLLGAVFKALA